jgi:hypothetical protein
MTDLRTAAQQALEALDSEHPDIQLRAAAALRAALAQAEQEPVAWMTHTNDLLPLFHKNRKAALNWQTQPTPLYTRPPRREWHGLKEWEINDGRDQLPTEDLCGWSFRQGVYFAEKALKEKNA